MPTSHALSLALQLTNLEARHLHAEKLLPDHLLLGLLKLVDVDLTEFLEALPAAEARATRDEIQALTAVFGAASIETTTLRRTLRYRLNPQGPSRTPSKQSPPPSLAYTDTLARADVQWALPTLALLTCGLEGCGEATLGQLRESGYDPGKVRLAAERHQGSAAAPGDWPAFIRGVAKLAEDWQDLPEASPPSLSAIWRRLLAKTQLRIEADGSLHARLGQKTVLRSPAELGADWDALFGADLAASLRQFAGQAREASQAIEVPADEL
jgi:hypothetical protein